VKIPRSRPARTAALREFRGLKFSRLPPYSYNTHGLPNLPVRPIHCPYRGSCAHPYSDLDAAVSPTATF
jgi:hypothetical protein